MRRIIDRAEKEFRTCWAILCMMKTGNLGTGGGDKVLSFQPSLAGSLFRLDEAYRRVQEAKNGLVRRKPLLSLKAAPELPHSGVATEPGEPVVHVALTIHKRQQAELGETHTRTANSGSIELDSLATGAAFIAPVPLRNGKNVPPNVFINPPGPAVINCYRAPYF